MTLLHERLHQWSALWLILLCVIALRFSLFDVPLERDEGEYAYMAQLLLDGIPPYVDAHSMKFPGIYAVYATILLIGGEGYQSIHAALLAVNLVSITLLYAIAKRLFNHLVGLVSAGAFSLMSLSYHVEGLWANAEHFVLPFALAGLLMVLKFEVRRSPLLFVGTAMLLSAAMLVKQHGAAFTLFGFLLGCWLLAKSRQSGHRLDWPGVILFTVGFLILPVTTVGALIASGAFDQFVFWTFTYASTYATQVPLTDARQYFIGTFFPLFNSTLLLWLLAMAGFIGLFVVSEVRKGRWIAVGFTIASIASVLPGFLFRPHYFILLLPAVALLSGVGLSSIRLIFSRSQHKIVAQGVPISLALIAGLGTILSHADVLFAFSPAKVARVTYGGNPFPESLPLAEFIKQRVQPNEKIGILGSEPQLLFYTQRRSATSFIYMYPLMEIHPYALQMQEKVISQLESESPKLLLFVNVKPSWLEQQNSERLIFEWFKRYVALHYRRIAYVQIPASDGATQIFTDDILRRQPATRYWIDVYERNRTEE